MASRFVHTCIPEELHKKAVLSGISWNKALGIGIEILLGTPLEASKTALLKRKEELKLSQLQAQKELLEVEEKISKIAAEEEELKNLEDFKDRHSETIKELSCRLHNPNLKVKDTSIANLFRTKTDSQMTDLQILTILKEEYAKIPANERLKIWKDQ